MAFKHNAGGTKHDGEKSAKTFMPVGSGHHPKTSKHGIKTSAPTHAHKLDGRSKAVKKS